MIFLLLGWLLLIVVGIKYFAKKDVDALNKENSLALRGICAIEIMLGHLGIATGSLLLYPNRKAGILFVGIFFVLSGYGLAYSVSRKENYMENFLRSRIAKIIVPAYVIYVVGVFVNIAIEGWTGRRFADIVNPIMFWHGTNWYVWELIGLYIVFWICEKFRLLRKNYLLVFLVSLAFVCAAFAFKINNPWYGSTFCFWLGLVFYENQAKVKELFYSKFPWLKIFFLSVTVCISILLFFVLGEESLIGNLIARNVASLAFSLLVIIILHYIQVGNVVSKWLGKYSYEIFLFHPLFIAVLREYVNNDVFLRRW